MVELEDDSLFYKREKELFENILYLEKLVYSAANYQNEESEDEEEEEEE